MNSIWRRTAAVLAATLLLVGGAAGLASAATGTFTGIGFSPNTATAEQLAHSDAVQKATNAGFSANQCVVSSEGYDYLPSRGSWRAEVTLTCDTTSPQLVTVPNLGMLFYGTAESRITTAGLTVGAEYWNDNGMTWGTVWDQAPAAGAQVPPGTSVTLYVANGQG